MLSREYTDHLMRLCYHKGSVGFLQQDWFKSAYEWFVKASIYAQSIGIEGLEEVIQPINHHLTCMKEREQIAEAREFCTRLLEIWGNPEVKNETPEFVEKLQKIATKPDGKLG